MSLLDRHIVLIGPSGAGKSATAEVLSSSFDFPCYDLDTNIAEMAGKTIPEIFAEYGEQNFRSLEAAALLQAVGSKAGVIATGAGIVDPNFIQGHAALGKIDACMVWLNASEETTWNRAGNDPNRPNAQDRAGFLDRYNRRYNAYRGIANFLTPTDEMNIREVAAQVARFAGLPPLRVS